MPSLPGPIVSVEWLNANLEADWLRIADVRWSLAGPPGRLYEGSWSHWSSDPSRPAATGAQP